MAALPRRRIAFFSDPEGEIEGSCRGLGRGGAWRTGPEATSRHRFGPLIDCFLAGFQEALHPDVVPADYCSRIPMAPPAQLPQSTAAVPLVARCVRELVAARYALTVGELASRVRASRRTLDRAFNAALGVTPIDHIRAWRATIRDHLLPLGLRFCEIAEALGYADSADFANSVREATGQTPTALAFFLRAARFPTPLRSAAERVADLAQDPKVNLLLVQHHHHADNGGSDGSH